jgi:DNA-binding PadR family transcriptional regulator
MPNRFEHFFGRARGRHGMGHFGRGFMDGGMGGRGFGMGRKLASQDLQLLILKLLAEKPRYGYEIIKELEDRTKGFYVPSPGMVYPALTYLQEIGHATMQADGARKLYSITEPGREHLTQNLPSADALFAQFERVGERMDRVRQALREEQAGEEDLGGMGGRHRGAHQEFKRALHDLQFALGQKWRASAAEQQRVAAILHRATEEIQRIEAK